MKTVRFESLPVGALFKIAFEHLAPAVIWKKVSKDQAETTNVGEDDGLPSDFLSVWDVFEVNHMGRPLDEVEADQEKSWSDREKGLDEILDAKGTP